MSTIKPVIPKALKRIMDEDLYRCVHCGLCLNVCPTYLETGLETESPRGRIALMKGVREGRIASSKRVVDHWDLCLGCRACEAACPSGVPYGRLIEGVREEVSEKGGASWRSRVVSAVMLRGLLPRLGLLRLSVRLLRLYQILGLQSLVRGSRLLKVLPGGLDRLEGQLPKISGRFFEASSHVYPAMGPKKMRVGLLAGCVMPLAQGPTMEAAVRVLQRNGCEVVAPPKQGCCGALNLHSGEGKGGRRMARKNIDVFLSAGVEKVVVASAGCGSAMKEYGHLLKDDAEYAEKATRLAGMTVDITEFLASLPFERPSGVVNRRVTYQDACHLVHAQGISEAPRRLLESISGVELVEMEGASQCCGAAGIYTITQRGNVGTAAGFEDGCSDGDGGGGGGYCQPRMRASVGGGTASIRGRRPGVPRGGPAG